MNGQTMLNTVITVALGKQLQGHRKKRLMISENSLKLLLQCTLACVLAFTLALPNVAKATDYNFASFASKKGCESIIFSDRRSNCKDLQDKKDEACNKKLSCDEGPLKKVIEKYENAKDDLEEKIKSWEEKKTKKASKTEIDKAENVKKDQENRVAKLKTDADALKAAAKSGISLAAACVQARENVQTMFKETIPKLQKTSNEVLDKRKKILERLEKSENIRGKMKKEYEDAKKGQDANKKSSSKRAWEDAARKVAEITKELEEFNKRHGKDFERNTKRLIDHYNKGKVEHDVPLQDAKKRLENCKKTSKLSY